MTSIRLYTKMMGIMKRRMTVTRMIQTEIVKPVLDAHHVSLHRPIANLVNWLIEPMTHET